MYVFSFFFFILFILLFLFISFRPAIFNIHVFLTKFPKRGTTKRSRRDEAASEQIARWTVEERCETRN